MPTPTEEINQVSQTPQTIAAFLIGIFMGVAGCWWFMDRYLTEHTKALEDKVGSFSKSLQQCEELLPRNNTVAKSQYDACLNNNNEFKKQNEELRKRLYDNNINILAYKDCRQDRQNWSNEIHRLNNEINNKWSSINRSSLDEQDIQKRESQRTEYFKLLEITKCHSYQTQESK